MKTKKISMAFFASFLMLLTIFSCDDNNSSQNSKDAASQSVSNSSRDEVALRMASASGTLPIYSFTGDVDFRYFSPDKEFTAYFVDNSTVNFIILKETDFGKVLPKGKYDIDFYEAGVVFHEEATDVYSFFGISADESKNLLTDLGRNKFANTNTTATGLIRNFGEAADYGNLDLSGIDATNVSTENYFKGKSLSSGTAPVETPSCDHGGLGSSSCSLASGTTAVGGGTTSGCSVSCKAGYYSCCVQAGWFTKQSCTCKKG
jgi:hypothetical protein